MNRRISWVERMAWALVVSGVWIWIGMVPMASSAAIETGMGVQFNQVNFTFDKSPWPNSSWGRMEVNPTWLIEFTGLKEGYLNVSGEKGWYVVNVPVSLESIRSSGESQGVFCTYFNLGLADPALLAKMSDTEALVYLQEVSVPVKGFQAYVTYTEEPQREMPQGQMTSFPLSEIFDWDAEGVGESYTSTVQIPPYIVSKLTIPAEILNARHTQDSSINVETAKNQCFPMSVANSLQYLEKVFGINVPHDHVMGLNGDKSLVGQLDALAGRSASSRRSGSGTWFTPMVKGKFQYLEKNGLTDRLVHKYQGRGWGTPPNEALPAGDYTSNGSTATDQGAAVTFEWLCQEIKAGEDVELVFSYDNASGVPTGGHAVRVFECGTVLGKPYIKYLHDRNQNDDTKGLEIVQVFLEDLDGDGLLNLGTLNREIRFALSESVAEELKTPTPTNTFQIRPTSTPTSTPTPTNTLQIRPTPTPTLETPPENCPIFFSIEEPNVLPNGGTHGDILVHNPGGPAFVLSGGSMPELMEPFFTSHEEALKYDVGLDGFDILQLNFLMTAKIPHKIVFTVEKPFKVTNTSHTAFADTLGDGDLLLTNGGVILSSVLIQPLRLIDANKQPVDSLGIDAIEIEGFLQSFDNLANTVIDSLEEFVKYTGGVPITIYFSLEEDNQKYLADSGSLLLAGTQVSADDLIMLQISGSAITAEVVRSGVDWIPSTATSILSGFSAKTNRGLDAAATCLSEGETHGKLGRIYFSTEFDDDLEPIEYEEGDLLFHQLTPPFNQLVATNAELTGYKEKKYGLDAVDLYPERIEYKPTVTPIAKPTHTPTPTFYPDPEGCVEAGDYYTSETNGLNTVVLGPVEIFAPMNLSNVPPRLSVTDCSGDGNLDVSIPWTESSAVKQAAIVLSTSLCEGKAPQTIEVVLKHGYQCKLTAYDDAGAVVDTAEAAEGSDEQTLTLTSATGIRIVEITGSEICILKVCWKCKAEEKPTPTSTPTPTFYPDPEGCVEAGDYYTTDTSGLTSAVLGPIEIFAPLSASGAPMGVNVTDCSGDGALDVSIPWSESSAAKLAAIVFSTSLCEGKAPQMIEVVLKHGYQCKLSAYDDAGNLVDSLEAMEESGEQTLTLTSSTGIRLVEIVGAEICIIQVCWKCRPSESPTPTPTPPLTDPGLGPEDGIQFYQVDFLFEDAKWENSGWGRLEINPYLLEGRTNRQQGYINVFSDQGWHVVNLPVQTNKANYLSTQSGWLVAYFNIGLVDLDKTADMNSEQLATYLRERSIRLSEFKAYVTYTEKPLLEWQPGAVKTFPLNQPWIWNAQGVSDFSTSIYQLPPRLERIPKFVIEPLFVSYTQPQSANVETAYNQCFPMSIANSLQYLENEFGLSVPDDHVMGLKGDNSLVGLLDTYANRSVTSRRAGSGTWFTPMVNGKFKYLSDRGLAGSLIHKYQGRGWGTTPNEALPAGDYTAHGSTLEDEGATVTFDWICQQIQDGEDVELVFSYDNAAGNATGGHAVRVFECGKILGKPYVKYLHDSNQNNDSAGLETVMVYLEDLDGDGLLNLGAVNREIRFAMAESMKSKPIQIFPHWGVTIRQVHFAFEKNQEWYSNWGRMEIETKRLAEYTGQRQGFVNVYANGGWIITNLPIDLAANRESDKLVTYFNLGMASGGMTGAAKSLNLYAEYSLQPVEKSPWERGRDLKGVDFELSEAIVWDALGISELDTPAISQAPPFYTHFEIDVSSLFEKYTQDHSVNIQTAYNQCFPMAIANSLQYLEDIFGISVPHNHAMGLKGDNTLVGQLDTYGNRSVTSRRSGYGMWFTPMIEGKFHYLADYNLDDKLVHKYQGRGWGTTPNQALPVGDYSAHGSTLKDEGGTVTYEWLREQIRSGEDVELVFSYDNAWGDATGGHAVRVFECGKILGKPYIKYLHDRNQSDDTDGLEEVLVNLEDLDGDGILNLGSTSREIRFAMAESIKDELKTPTPTQTPKVVPTSTPTSTPTLRPPTPTNTPRPSPTPTIGYTGPWVYDDLIVAQGLGGQTLINIRYYNQEIGALSSIRRAFSGISGAFLDRIGGGEGRATYLSVGDLDGDEIQDVVTTFGLVLGDSPFPNIVVVRNSQTQKVIGSSFVAFPMGEKPPQYNGGEIRTAVGNFTGAKLPQIAVAQGFGGTGVIRLYQYTSNPPPNSWEVVGQFNGLPANLVNQVDSTGKAVSIGLTVAAGDLDQDGLDELVVGQTNGPTSQTIFHVLDIDNKGGIARRTTYAGFKTKFRGNGGIELQVGDLNGDRYPEIVVGSMGNLRNFNDERDTVPLNLVGIISPVVENKLITGFTRPLGKSVFNAFTEEINPSGAVTLAIGEFDGNPTNGKELAVGTNAYQEIDGKNVISRLWPSEPRYKILRLEFDGKTVNAVNTLGPVNGYVAFVGKAVPTSKAIFMAAIPKLVRPDLIATPTPTKIAVPTPTITPTPTPYIQPKLGWIPFVEGAKEGAGSDSIMKEETTSGLLVNFNIPGMFAKEFKVDDVMYHRLIVPGLGHRDRLGEPELPIMGRMVEVPYGVSFSLEIYKSESIALPHYNIYPAQEHNIRMATTAAALLIDKPLYQRDEFYPKNLAEFSAEDVGVIRGHRVMFLRVNPIQFNPVTDELRAYSNIEVRIVYNRPAQIDRVDERRESAAFEEMLQNSLINYKNPNRFEREPVYEEPNGCDYLIITDGRFFDAKDPTNPLTELSNWKRQKGYYTRIVSTADIQNGTTAAGLQAYIQNAYDRWYPCPSYVLLVGDAEMIPPVYQTPHSSHGNTLIGTDLYYATVDGNDYFPDLYIGRLSVDTPAQLETVVDKILAYEKEPPNTAAYYTDTSLACLFEDVDPINGEEDDTFRIIEMAEEIRTFLNGQGYDCERIYNRSGNHLQGPLRYENGTAIPVELTLAGNPGAGIPGFPWDGDDGDITDAINNGNFIITFNGHGGNQSWGRPNYTNANVNALTNGNLTPVVFCIACKNGWFDNETDAAATGTGVNTESMCEAFQRLANGGCVATIGSTRNSSSPNDFLILGLYKAIWPTFDPNPPISGRTLADLEMGPLVRMGQINTFGKIYIAESFAHGDARLRTFEMYTLFGCPEMPVWTENPRKLRVKHPEGIGSTGEQAFVVQVNEDATANPINNAVVVLTQENHIIKIGTTNAGGYAEFTLTDPFNRPIVVTVTKRNYRPYEGAMEVSATGGLINRLAPDNGIEGQDVLIGGKNFQAEQVDIYFDGTLKKTAAAGAAGSFGQAGVEDISIQVPAPYTLGPVNIMAKGRTSGRYAVDIFRVRSKNPIDLYTYSQWASSTWHLHPGQNETWNNPEIQLYDASNNPVSSNNLTTGEQYTIRATIHNDTDFPAQSARVTFKWADFGVGQPDRVWEEIDTDDVDVPAHGTAQAEVVWTPPRTGHLCVLVDIYHVEDIETGNNQGQENCHVGPTSSPANVKFTIWNPTDTPAMYYLELRQLIPVKYEGKIPLWTTKIRQPDPQLIQPGDKREIEVEIDPEPADVQSGQEAEFALTGFINGKVCGGVNFIITKK